MPVTSCTTDLDALTLNLVADLAAPPSRAWQLWADPRQLERWWGPPGWPTSFEVHDVRVGGESHYVMTGPDGEKSRGWWRILSLDEPRSLEFEDGFSDDGGTPNREMPTTVARVDLQAAPGGTRMTLVSRFPDRDALQQMAEMGMVEGITAAAGQMDAILSGG